MNSLLTVVLCHRSLDPGETLQAAVAHKLLRPASCASGPCELAYMPGRDGKPVLRPVWLESSGNEEASLARAARSRPQLWTIKPGSEGAIVPASHTK